MMTNTYTPFVGGVAWSVTAFTQQCRDAGHRVIVVAPVYEGAPSSEEDVIRIPAIQDFNGSDFSVALPVPGHLTPHLDECRPDVVHSHHPHLLGNTAVGIASRLDRPLVFTHHTMYERLVGRQPSEPKDESKWHQAMEEVKAEWELLRNVAGAVGHAILK